VQLAKYCCPKCRASQWTIQPAFWRCDACGERFACARGIPKLYLEETLAPEDRNLRDRFYDGFVGAHYRYVMPFLALPARPLRLSWPDWIAYAVISALLLGLLAYLLDFIVVRRLAGATIWDGLVIALAAGVAIFFWRHRYLLYLFGLALPVKISLSLRKFKPDVSFADVHARAIASLSNADRALEILDVSTGNCAALYRHGWMSLNAQYTGVDLSEVMIFQGLDFMARQHVPMDFVLADAANLPFKSDCFDVVLNYGAINSMKDPQRALSEMSRVGKTGGLILFFDEQLYEGASAIERVYFHKVLSSHNVIHRCPIELMPTGLTHVEVHQVYEFYYICTAIKA